MPPDASALTGLIENLHENSNVSRLGLHDLDDEPEGRMVVFKQLSRFKRLRELRWTGPLDLACVSRLAEILCDPACSLQSLDLAACGLDEASLKALSLGIEGSASLREFRLANHVFTVEGARALAAAITASSDLLILKLDECDIDTQLQSQALGKAVESSRSLREFHIRLKDQVARHDHSNSSLIKRFTTAATKSNSLLHMTIGRNFGWGLREAQAKLAQNRKRLEAGIET